jgi:hypothetical protein
MYGLIDLDMVCHEMGHLRRATGEKDADGNDIFELFSLDEVVPLAKGRVQSIISGAQLGGWSGFLTRGRHYRHEQATILPYKGHRESAPRNHVDELKRILHEDLEGIWCDGREADDAMSTIQWTDLHNVVSSLGWDDATLREHAGTVIATRDKDLETVPGWHFKWWIKDGRDRAGQVVPEQRRLAEKGEIYWVTQVDAHRNFYTQCLLGDTSDNIPGLYGVGKKSDWIKQLYGMETELEMYTHVHEKYIKYYKNYGTQFLYEVANLLHMQRCIGDVWEAPDGIQERAGED